MGEEHYSVYLVGDVLSLPSVTPLSSYGYQDVDLTLYAKSFTFPFYFILI